MRSSSIEALFLVTMYPKIHEVYYLKSQYGKDTQNSMSYSFKRKMTKQYARHGKILKYQLRVEIDPVILV